MRRFSVDRSTRGMNLDVEKMDVIVIEIVNCELYTWVKGVEFSENVRNVRRLSKNKSIVNIPFIEFYRIPEFDSGLIIISSNSVIIMLARVGPSGKPIETPSICLYSLSFKEKMVFVQQSSISFLSVRFFSVVEIRLFLYIRFKMMLTVFLSGILVKRDVTSKETNLYPSLKRFPS